MEQAITILGIIVSALASCAVAIINSNAQRAKTEQKVEDTFSVIKENLSSVNERLDELKETDSCCTILKDDVADIKENITLMSATLNQFKANSDEFDSKMKVGFIALASDSIEQAHRYYMQKGYITESSKKSVHAVYDSYKEFGGNGYEDRNIVDIDSLPERH